MNIVILSNYLPYPLTSGGAQAQFNMIDELRKEHKISFVFTQEGRNKLSAMRELQAMWPEVDFFYYSYIRQLLNPRFLFDKIQRAWGLFFRKKSESFLKERTLKPYGIYFSRDFVNFVCSIVHKQKADIVQVEFFPCLEMAKYLSKDVKKIFIHHEIRYVRNERLLSSLKLTESDRLWMQKVKAKEIEDLNRYDNVVTLTSIDKDLLVSSGVKVPISVSPAAVNAKVSDYQEWNGKVCFLGGYDHIPNKEGVEWFLSSVVPYLKNKSLTDFHIVGKGWPNNIGEGKEIKVTVHGFVEDLSEAIGGSIMIVPILTGSGMRMKILEAAAMSLPMLTTTVGVEGLEYRNEDSCLIADSPEMFAHALDRLITDCKLRAYLAQNANRMFVDKYSIKSLASLRDNVYSKLFADQTSF